jgi:neutral ceramidase
MITAVATNISILPQQVCELAGFSGSSRVWHKIASDIECNLLVFRDGATCLIFLSVDALFAGAEVYAHALKLSHQHFGSNVSLIIAASHTHNAPMLDRQKPLLGQLNEAHLENLFLKLNNLFETASNSNALEISFSVFETTGTQGINRRRFSAWRNPRKLFRKQMATWLAPNPKAEVDNSIKCVVIRDPEGSPIAAILHVTCHPNCYPDETAISSDFIGGLRSVLRKHYRADLPIVFLQGFSGDVRPNCEGPQTLMGFINTVRGGPTFRPTTQKVWDLWLKSLTDNLNSLVSNACPVELIADTLYKKETVIPLSQVLTEYRGAHHLQVVQFELAPTLSGIAVNAEMLSGWKKAMPSTFLNIGCINDTFGYLPTAAETHRGGYEVDRFMFPFGLKATGWQPDFEDRILSCLKSSLVSNLGNLQVVSQEVRS